MNFKSLSLLALIFSQNILGIAVEPINMERVQKAQQTYAHEEKYAAFVRYTMVGVSAAVVAYTLYKWYKPVESAASEQKALLAQLLERIQRLESQKSQNSSPNQIPETPKTDIQTSLTDNAPIPGTFNRSLQWASTTASTGLNWAGSIIAMNIATSAFGKIMLEGATLIGKLPASGALSWYIVARTDFNRVTSELMNALSNSKQYQDDIPVLTQQCIYEIEKILGYLHHFMTITLQQAPINTKAAANRYSKNIERFTNEFVDAVNRQDSIKSILEKFQLAKTEILLAIQFVEPRI
jgi:hypothetical protein